MHPYFRPKNTLATQLDTELATSLAHESQDEPDPEGDSGLVFNEDSNSGLIAAL